MSKSTTKRNKISSMNPFSYWYWGEISDTQIQKKHKHEANRRDRRLAKQELHYQQTNFN